MIAEKRIRLISLWEVTLTLICLSHSCLSSPFSSPFSSLIFSAETKAQGNRWEIKQTDKANKLFVKCYRVNFCFKRTSETKSGDFFLPFAFLDTHFDAQSGQGMR